MSTADEFWQHAKEAILSACDAKTDTDKEGLLELARTWTQAALRARDRLVADQNCRTELSAGESGNRKRVAISLMGVRKPLPVAMRERSRP
jgi:hypothetical protein